MCSAEQNPCLKRELFDTDSLREYTLMFFADRVFCAVYQSRSMVAVTKGREGHISRLRDASDSRFLVGDYFWLVIAPNTIRAEVPMKHPPAEDARSLTL